MTNIMQKILLIIILVTSVQKINAQDFEKIANEIMVKKYHSSNGFCCYY